MIRFSHTLCIIHKTDVMIVKQQTTTQPYVMKRVVPHFDEDVLKNFNAGKMSPGNHPGLNRPGLMKYDHLLETIDTILEGYRKKRPLLEDAALLCKYMDGRQRPVTRREYSAVKKKTIAEVQSKMSRSKKAQSMDEETLNRVFSNNVNHLIKKKVYNWAPINYTSYVGHQYLINRMPGEFAALNRIFREIGLRCPDFKPKSLLDYGSGVGTVTLAALRYWEDSINECFNVDSSPDMHEIAEVLLKGGNKDNKSPIPYLFYRQFLPASNHTKFDLVVCSYTLFEFPSTELRLQTMTSLWNKTSDFFIVVEKGNSEGFKMIHEIRDFILETESDATHSEGVHIFAPCPHELECPFEKITEKPCCTYAHYMLPPVSRRQVIKKELYSYIVFRKGPRPENDKQWPRMVLPSKKLRGVSLCHLCTKDGKLRRLAVSKQRHGKDYFRFAKCLRSGERLPIQFTDIFFEEDDYEGINVDELTKEDDIPDFSEEEDESGDQEKS